MTRVETITLNPGDKIVHEKQYGSIVKVEPLLEVVEMVPHGARLLDVKLRSPSFAGNDDLRNDYRVATPEDIEAAKPKPKPEPVDWEKIKRERLAKVGR